MPIESYLTDLEVREAKSLNAENSGNGARLISIFYHGELLDGYEKTCSYSYPVALAFNEILMSIDYRLSMGEKAAEVLPVYQTVPVGYGDHILANDINGNYILEKVVSVTLKNFSTIGKTVLSTEELVKRGFIKTLVASYFRKEGDLHIYNVDEQGRRVDFDSSNYGEKIVNHKGRRFIEYFVSLPDFDFSNDVFKNFPDITGIGPCHWPTHWVPRNMNVNKSYSDNTQFVNLKKYVPEILTAFVEELFISRKQRELAYAKYINDKSLINEYCDFFEKRKKELSQTLFAKDFIYKKQLNTILFGTYFSGPLRDKLRLESSLDDLIGHFKNCRLLINNPAPESGFVLIQGDSDLERSSSSSNDSINSQLSEPIKHPTSPDEHVEVEKVLNDLLAILSDYRHSKINDPACIMLKLGELKSLNIPKNDRLYRERQKIEKHLKKIFNWDCDIEQSVMSEFAQSCAQSFWQVPEGKVKKLDPLIDLESKIAELLLDFLSKQKKTMLTPLINSAYAVYTQRPGAFFAGSRENELSPKLKETGQIEITSTLLNEIEKTGGWGTTAFNTQIFCKLFAEFQKFISGLDDIDRLLQRPTLSKKTAEKIKDYNIVSNAKNIFLKMNEIHTRLRESTKNHTIETPDKHAGLKDLQIS